LVHTFTELHRVWYHITKPLNIKHGTKELKKIIEYSEDDRSVSPEMCSMRWRACYVLFSNKKSEEIQQNCK
jgi:hypothetical protein